MEDILTSEHWKNICELVRPIAQEHIFPFIKSKRVRSGVMSELFETQAAIYYNSIGIPTESCINDSEPDLYFTEIDKTCEIKVTSSHKREWMGNHISKKSSEFILSESISKFIFSPINAFTIASLQVDNDFKL